MTDDDSTTRDGDDVLLRLGEIESQPLEAQALAFARVHDALQARLEGSDSVAHD